jgi:hypothetical protein
LPAQIFFFFSFFLVGVGGMGVGQGAFFSKFEGKKNTPPEIKKKVHGIPQFGM